MAATRIGSSKPWTPLTKRIAGAGNGGNASSAAASSSSSSKGTSSAPVKPGASQGC
ncbi:MAG: hypothetical protein IPM07_16440 [Anaerolineales bacterium]|nr:hypothetical protein [Anaerolineales bacterium]